MGTSNLVQATYYLLPMSYFATPFGFYIDEYNEIKNGHVGNGNVLREMDSSNVIRENDVRKSFSIPFKQE